MSTDNLVQLNSLVNKNIDLYSLGERQIDISSLTNSNLDLESYAGDKVIIVTSSTYADENTDKFRYDIITPLTKVTGAKYQISKPPKQRI